MNITIKKLQYYYSRIPVQVKASIWFAICSILQKSLSIITVPIFTRLMTTEQYGYYTTYISWYNLLLVFTSLNLFLGVFNNAMMKFKDDKAGYISSMQGLTFIITSIFFLFYLFFHEKVNTLLGMNTTLVLMLFLELLMTPALEFWLAANRFEFQYRSVVIVTLTKMIMNPVLGLLLVLFFEKKDIARIASIVITEVIICLIVAVHQFQRGKRFFSKEYWRYALLFNIPLLPHYLSGQILNQCDRIMISKIVGNSAVAVYGVAYNIGLLMNIFINAINGSYTPWFYQNIEKHRYVKIQSVTKLIVCLMAVLIAGLMLFAPEVMAILGTSEYQEGVYVIPPVAAGAFFFFLYNIYANIEFYFEKKQYVLLSSIISAILNLILNFIFIPRYGYVAAAYTTLTSYFVYCVLHNRFACNICRKEKIPSSIFSLDTAAFAAIAVISGALFMNVLYKYIFARYGIIVIISLIIIWKRDGIITLIMYLKREFL